MRPGTESDPSLPGRRLRAGACLFLILMIAMDLGCSQMNTSGGPRYRREGHAPLVNRFKRMGGHLRGHHDALGQPERPDTWAARDVPGLAAGPQAPARPQPRPSEEIAQAQAPITRGSTIPSRVDPIPAPAPAPIAEVPMPAAPRSGLNPPAPLPIVDEPVRADDQQAAPGPDVLDTIEQLVDTGRARLEAMATYQCLLTRQERVGPTLWPVEDVLLSVRREPKAIRLEWPDGPNKGRQVFYSTAETDGLMVVRMSSPLIPPLRLAPDSPMAMNNSRHPITEAGLEPIFDDIADRIERARQGDASIGTFSYEGQETPEAVGAPCHKIVRVTPEGETWQLYLDVETHLPALLEGTAANGGLLERYHFQDIRPDPTALADASAFNPGAVGNSTVGGLFGRRPSAGATEGPSVGVPR